jgi:type VI secretion system protein ImpM
MGDFSYQIAYFGKLPSFGDFVRYNAGGGEVRLFEQWIQEGLYFSQKQYAQEWNSLFPSAPSYNFVFAPHEGGLVLLGVLKASRDRSGRHYPFVLLLKLSKGMFLEASPAVLPLLFKGFLDQALKAVVRFSAVTDLRTLAEEAHGLEAHVPRDLQTPAAEFESFLNGTRLRDLWRAVLDREDDPRRFLLMKNLSEILVPMKGHHPEQMALGLRFPLGAAADRKDALLAFWTRLSLRMLGDPDLVPTEIWHAWTPSGPENLYLHLRPPLAGSFSQLLRPEAENDNLCKLEEEGSGGMDSAFEKMGPALQRVLSEDQSSLAQFLDQF